MARSSNIGFMSIEEILTLGQYFNRFKKDKSSHHQSHPLIMQRENKDISAQLLNIKQNGLDIDIPATTIASTSVQLDTIKLVCDLSSKHQLYPSAVTSTISRSICEGFHNAINPTQ
ncbi:hypothetical protein TIFTF001_033640 [Ficus carica]|uniref:Uncharacterized protein n=1 Tax=Ficus carica TaxID=3494 RepID=A0AA88J7W1_FICCA|nr:hypothetical protein TIFTF001_033640 [Ficus carica]